MHLKTQFPRVITHHQCCQFLVRKHRDSPSIGIVGLTVHLCQSVLPTIQEHVTTGTVGHYQIGSIGLHRLKLNTAIGYRVAAVFLKQVMTKTKTTAVSALWIIDILATECLHQPGQYTGKLSPTKASVRKDLGIVAAHMIDNPQRLAAFLVYQPIRRTRGKFLTKVIYQI